VTARTELQTWYLRELRPKLAQAVRAGAVDPRAAAALHAELRELLELTPEREPA
jgi:hypothetical protein